jgi:hypothetical protein
MMFSKPESFPESSFDLTNILFSEQQYYQETVDEILSPLLCNTAASHNNQNDHEDTFSMDGFSLPSTSSFDELHEIDITNLSFESFPEVGSNSSSLITAQPNHHLNSTVEVLLMTQNDTSTGSESLDNNWNGDVLVELPEDPDTEEIDSLIVETLCLSAIAAQSNQYPSLSGEVTMTQDETCIVPSSLQSPLYWGKYVDYVLSELLEQGQTQFNKKQIRRFLKLRIIRERKKKSKSKQASSTYSTEIMNVLLVLILKMMIFNSENPFPLIYEGTSTNTKKKKTYKYKSRHRHAKKRPRDKKGKFLKRPRDSKCGIITDGICVEERNRSDSSLTTRDDPPTNRKEMTWPPAMEQKHEEVHKLYDAFHSLRQSIPTIMPSSLAENVESRKEKKEKECDKSIKRTLRLTREGNQYPLLEKDISIVFRELIACRKIFSQKGWDAVLRKLKKMPRRPNSNKSNNTTQYECYNCSYEMRTCPCLSVQISVPFDIWKYASETDLKEELLKRFENKIMEKSKKAPISVERANSGHSTDARIL